MPTSPCKTLIVGGVRSGKSFLAEQLAAGSGLDVIYFATATAGDEEMKRRINHHRHRRPHHWCTIEVPLKLAASLRQQDGPDRCLLVDCLTLWLTNLLLADDPAQLETERQELLESLSGLRAPVILVSNETGLGIIPPDPLSRRFGDEAGRLHQTLARICDRVIFTVAGLPQVLKGPAL